MLEFYNTIINHAFMQNALITGLLASIACGVTGTYVVVRQMASISGGIAHAVIGGIGIAYFYGVNPIIGAILFALLSAMLLGLVTLRAKSYEDTVIGAIWATGMALGIIFISLTPGYAVDLMSFLFGNILMVSRTDLRILAGLDLLIIILVILFYRQFLAVCFDEGFARLRGINVEAIYLLLLCIIALTIVVLIQVVGLILVISLLTLPAAISNLFSRSLGRMMLYASILGWLFTTLGLALSYGLNFPAGATIIIVTGFSYFLALGVKSMLHRHSLRNGAGEKRPEAIKQTQC